MSVGFFCFVLFFPRKEGLADAFVYFSWELGLAPPHTPCSFTFFFLLRGEKEAHGWSWGLNSPPHSPNSSRAPGGPNLSSNKTEGGKICGQEWRFLPIFLFLCFWGDEDRVTELQLNSNTASAWENVDGGDVFQAAELVWRQEKTPASPAFAPGAQPWPPLHSFQPWCAQLPLSISRLCRAPLWDWRAFNISNDSVNCPLRTTLVIPYIERQPKWSLCASYKNSLIFVI